MRCGINPVTGEVFDVTILSENITISREIIKLALETQNGIKYEKQGSKNTLCKDVAAIYDELRRWRLDEAYSQGLPAYYIFSNNDLMEIACGDVIEKEDCIGNPQICVFFAPSVSISSDEIAMWPKEISDPYGTLHMHK